MRNYCYKPYKDGKYYSDCSSSIILTFQAAGFKFPWTLNTAGIYESDLFEKVPVILKNGHIVNPEVLKEFDCLLYRGNDPTRPLQIGHVEAVYEIRNKNRDDKTGWIYDGKHWYYREKPCKNVRGWKSIVSAQDGFKYWYYFNNSGIMVAGWQCIDGEWWYFEPTGSYQGALYHTDSRGAQSKWRV